MEVLRAAAEGAPSDLKLIARIIDRPLETVIADAAILARLRSTEQFTYAVASKGEGWWYPGVKLATFQSIGLADFDDPSNEKLEEVWPRGHAKTTLFGKIGNMRQMLYSESRYKLIFAATSKNKRGLMASHRMMLTDRHFFPELHYLLPYFMLGADPISKYSEQDGVLVLGNGARIEYVSMEGENRGANSEEGRPDTIDLDDILPSTARKSDADRERVTDTFFSVIRMMGSASCRFHLRGTILHRQDIVCKIAEHEIGGWNVRRLRAYNPDTREVLWPERWTYEALMEIYQTEYIKSGRADLWACEMLNDPSTASTNPFVGVLFKKHRRHDLDPASMYRVMFIDHAAGTGGDNFVIAETGHDATDTVRLLRVFAENRINLPEKLAKVLQWVKQRRPHVLGCEDTSESRTFIEVLEKYLRDHGEHITIERPKAVESKNDRIRAWLEPRYVDGTITHPETDEQTQWVEAYEAEARSFDVTTQKNTDDRLDTVARCVEFSRPARQQEHREPRPLDPIMAMLHDDLNGLTPKQAPKYNAF